MDEIDATIALDDVVISEIAKCKKAVCEYAAIQDTLTAKKTEHQAAIELRDKV